MERRRALSLTLWATVSGFSLNLANAAAAQENAAVPVPSAAPQEARPADGGEIIITGTRRADLTAAESPTPIDIISSAELLSQGSSDVNDILRQQVPALNIQRFTSNDGAVFTRPYSMRGLPPDQTLVLVNGKRRHRGATVQLSNIPYIRGSQGPDLSTIPSIAIGQLEVLRDGASANYGSDAIAGVLNFRLRDDNHGATVIARYGQYYAGDGEDVLLQGNVGLPFTANGFVNISGEYTNASITSRQNQRPDAQALIDAGVPGVPVPAQRTGNPDTEAARMFFNAGVDLGDTMEFYTFGNYSWSAGTTAFFYRNPVTNPLFASVPLTNTPGGPRFTFRTWFPGGFSPDFSATIRDMSLVSGVRGNLIGDLAYDLSGSFGRNKASYRITNTVNPSLGPQSPTEFRAGALEQRELNANFDLTYPLEVGLAGPLNLAGGLEYRRETWEVTPGDLASYQVGPFASVPDPDTPNPNDRIGLPAGASGFPGFGPLQAGTFARDNWAAYAAIEGDLTQWLSGGIAARYEDFSDFGSTFTWRINSRIEFSDAIAVRGGVNTGFRAPTPGQSNVSQAFANIDALTGQSFITGIVSPLNPVAQLFGARPLEPEKSFNVTAGLVLTPANRLTFTIDYFNIKIEDRIGLSGNFTLTQAQRDQLVAAGVPGGGDFRTILFFGNAFDSRTQGFDAVLTWGFPLLGGNGTLAANLNYTKNEVTRAGPLITGDRERLLELENFVPDWRGSLAFNYQGDRIGFSTTASYYGQWTDYGPDPANDQTGSAEILVDAEISYRLNDTFTLAVGGSNIFDNYPDREVRPGQLVNGFKYLRFSPIGFNGGFWYLRGTARF
ncbi:TonB-dependent receptor [Sphingosinicella sp. LHD-64]|uniref:TonB-dependent receptor plug domain-containing protein n=1 Tax=Sphingosinicella sp. LHD-64 TaxID=3072139 RepID=UPI00280E29E6|nr:TonB-dependent receptor [Sphingosinicella sp. LHD-64]MDQ8757377.1 TonB-dependent receptor [Sphingosinicella sp. LHD-64]